MFGNLAERIDNLETELVTLEQEVSRIRARQVEVLTQLDAVQVYLTDGDRGMEDWVASRLDVSRPTAHRLMTITHATDPWHLRQLAAGRGGWTGRLSW
jgi:hypothetical protein